MPLLTLTANEPAWTEKPTGYALYLNTDQVIGFVADPEIGGKARVYVMHGPLWSLGDGSFGTAQTLAEVKAQWPGIPKLTAHPGAYDLYVNPRYIIGFGPAAGDANKSRLAMQHGPYSKIGDGSFIVSGTPAQLATAWPSSY